MANRLGKDSNVYSDEKSKLAAISFVFGVSYLFDVVYDFYLLSEYSENECAFLTKIDPDCETFGWLLLEQCYFIIDLVPIFILLIMHYRNFKLPAGKNQPVLEEHRSS